MMRMKKMRSEAGKEGIMKKTKDSKRCCNFVLFIVKRKKCLWIIYFPCKMYVMIKIIKRKFMKTNVDYEM